MKVSELITKLQHFQSEHGDLPVKLYADHGQVHMEATQVELTYTEDLEEYMSEPIHPDDAESGIHQQVCEVS